VPGAEPPVERNKPVAAIVYFEVLVVEVMSVGMAIEHPLARRALPREQFVQWGKRTFSKVALTA
jgi:hypothetical protein